MPPGSPLSLLASPTFALPSSAFSQASGGTASGFLTMNQPFNVGSGSATATAAPAGTVADSYQKILVPAAIAMLALVMWLRK